MIALRKIILLISVVLISVSVYAQKPKYEKANFKGTELEYLIKTCKETKHFFQLLTYAYLYFKNEKSKNI